MEKQTYKNHIRYYAPHHFIFYPAMAILLGISIYKAFTAPAAMAWTFISLIFIIFIFLGLMLRQHYALTLQDRIVKLEFSFRYFALTGKRIESMERQLSDAQIFALRFAPDDELVKLIEKTLSENLSAEAIKKSIINWKGDYERV